MCKLKMGSEVKTSEDLQDLISNVILTRDEDFDRLDIISETQKKLHESVYAPGKEMERFAVQAVARTLLILEEIGYLGYAKGRYRVV